MTINTDDRVPFVVTAEYQLFGEYRDGSIVDAEKWVIDILHFASSEGFIENGYFIHSAPGPWGLQLVIFEVTMMMKMESTRKALRKKAAKRLNKIVNDSDVNVRWIRRK